MPGYVTATAIVSLGKIGIRKPRNMRVQKRRSGRIKESANTAARPRDRPSRTSASKFPSITDRHG